MWEAARTWVSAHCEMKIRTVTESLIETDNPVGSNAACRVTRSAEPTGGYSFNLVIAFANPFVFAPSGRLRSFANSMRTARGPN
jgi:hypothetical protein